MMKIRSAFSNAVRLLRKKKKMSSRKLAELCGVSHTYLRMIEVGMRLPPAEDKIKKIAYHIGIKSDYLLNLAGKIDTEVYNIILENLEAPELLREKYKR